MEGFSTSYFMVIDKINSQGPGKVKINKFVKVVEVR